MAIPKQQVSRFKEYIIDYILDHPQISIFVKERKTPLTVNLPHFWMWMKSKGYHEWVYDYNDPSQPDGHGQKSGQMNSTEYFNTRQDNEIKMDLFEYLLEKRKIIIK